MQADVVIFFKSADEAAGASASAPAGQGGGGEEAAGGGVGGEQGEGAVLTVVVRPLPSTAPASVDSGSSRGGEKRPDDDTPRAFTRAGLAHCLCRRRFGVYF